MAGAAVLVALGVLVRGQIVEHVLHAPPTAQVHHAAEQLELVVEARANEEDHEVPVDLGGHAAPGYLGHCHTPVGCSDCRARSYCVQPPEWGR